MPYKLTIPTLEKGWQEFDTILLHASFQCLVDCVEKDNLLQDNRDWLHTPETQAAHQELTALYNWWKAKTTAATATSGSLDTKSEQFLFDNEMLIRLIKIRGFLWT